MRIHRPGIAASGAGVCRLGVVLLWWAWCAAGTVACTQPATLWTEPAAEAAAGGNAAPKPRLAVLPLELSGDLGGEELAAQHATRLAIESMRLRRDLEGTQMYEVLDNAPAQAEIDKLTSQQLHLHECNGCDIGIGRTLGADLVLLTWVNRVSALILTLTYEIHRVHDAEIVARKSYDFRGDNDNAWDHAIDYMVRHLREDAPSSAH